MKGFAVLANPLFIFLLQKKAESVIMLHYLQRALAFEQPYSGSRNAQGRYIYKWGEALAKAYVFYNPLAGNGVVENRLEALKNALNFEVVFCNMTHNAQYNETLSKLQPEDILVLCGGDGTLNRFANFTDLNTLQNEVFYYPCGTGNDFAKDIGQKAAKAPFNITKYLKNLPTVTVKGKSYRFINGIGYGIDGYCCEVGDELKKRSQKAVNYTRIALKGLLYGYKPTAATVTVDGVQHRYKKVWLAPAMNGRYFGGGMMPTPQQDRLSENGTLSVMLFHGAGKVRALVRFPTLFTGKHPIFKKHVKIFSGHEITVAFDRPTALQIDGETVLNVTEYTATKNAVKAKKEPALSKAAE